MNNNIRRAAFVSLSEEKSERLKYEGVYNIIKYLKKRILTIKRGVNTLLSRIKFKLSFVDWETVKKASFIWIAEAGIEGFLINFALHHLFGFKLNIWTIFSYGIIVKETIDIHRRLRDGNTAEYNKKTSK